jgi:3-(3-hydroxy-phenyl)propionate hydroxylase
LEEYLIRRAEEVGVEIRWKNRVGSVQPRSTTVLIDVHSPDGSYQLEADWLVAADGARSPIRSMLGLDVEGHVFQDRFLIADVHMTADFPPERWFWFDPPFHPNQSVLLHRQADNVWRIDFQLGWNGDPEQEKKPESVIPRIQAMLGADRKFELEWVSVYTFQCRRMKQFRHGRVFFVGDAAHQVSPFGARGANSGIQDTDNLIWKLKLVMEGRAPEELLDSYSRERVYAADENILNSTRSTDFITPKTPVSRTFRNAVLELAQEYPFARKLVNSGRLSVPAILADSPLITLDVDAFAGNMVPGAPLEDGPLDGGGWLLRQVGGRFQGLYFTADCGGISSDVVGRFAALSAGAIPIETIVIAKRAGDVPHAKVLVDGKGVIAPRYDAQEGTYYLVRPDQHVAGRWRDLQVEGVRQALDRATCNV